jgi:hypothetical protein
VRVCCLPTTRIAQPPTSSISRRGQIPIARRTAAPYLPRFPPLELFGRRPPVLVASIRQRPASENLHILRTGSRLICPVPSPNRTSLILLGTSEKCRYCRKSRFALGVGNSAGCRCDFRVKMRRASSVHVKLTSDIANTSEAIRIGDCFSFDSFAKNLSLCNFRLLQQYRPTTDLHAANTSHTLSRLCAPSELEHRARDRVPK